MKTEDETPVPAPPATASSPPSAPAMETITLETPIVRGEQTIDSVQVRKPKAGELRGLQLQSVAQGDTNSLLMLLPRITVPPLAPHEVEQLEPADFGAFAGTVQGFFMSKAERQAIERALGLSGPETTPPS